MESLKLSLTKILGSFKNNQHIRLLKTLWPFLWSGDRAIRNRFIGTILIILTSTTLSILVPLLFKRAVDTISFWEHSKENFIFFTVGLYGLIWTLTRFSINLREVLMFRVMEKGVSRLSAFIFEHIHSLSYDFHTKRKTGEITSIIEKAQHAFPGILWPLFFLIIPTFLEVFCVSCLISYLYGFCYGFIMITTIALFLLYSTKVLKWSLEALRDSNQKHYECNSNIVDSFINFSTIRFFNNQRSEFQKYRRVLGEREDLMVVSLMRGRWVSLGQDLIIGIALLLFSVITAYKVLHAGFTVGDFVLLNSYILQFSIPLGSLGFILKNFREELTHMEKVIELLNCDSTIPNGTETFEALDDNFSIVFKDIYFGYQEKRPILKGVSFDLLPGKTVAIVGPTGSGKSTITHLLMRSYECGSGEIFINGQNIRNLKQTSFLKYIGVVPQDITLFNDTLRNNLIYGNPDISEERLKEVITLTYLDFLVGSLPNALETVVGERGLALSTGEKQKVGIARTLIKQPAVYIFDEATSSLDVETEKNIMQNIRNKIKNATVLIIAHRLSTIRNADKIIVFEKGAIVETGTHTSLIEMNGAYAALCAAQEGHTAATTPMFVKDLNYDAVC